MSTSACKGSASTSNNDPISVGPEILVLLRLKKARNVLAFDAFGLGGPGKVGSICSLGVLSIMKNG